MSVQDETTYLLERRGPAYSSRSTSIARANSEAPETDDDQASEGRYIGERLPYNDYTTIDWIRGLVKDSDRLRSLRELKGIRWALAMVIEQSTGWIAVTLMGCLTACIAFLVDVCEATVDDWKIGYCENRPFLTQKACCRGEPPLAHGLSAFEEDCKEFHRWSDNWWAAFAIFGGLAVFYGSMSATATLLTKRKLPSARPRSGNAISELEPEVRSMAAGKTLYMAAGSGIPEIKTILSGFRIPNYLDCKVLFVKAFGAVFAVATGMCLGKEGPFVHISACIGHFIAKRLSKYKDNDRKLREILSAAVAAGLSVAFGAPIGGVLFSYEEISTFFPRRVLWKAFVCSMSAAVTLKALDPMGTGRLIFFRTTYRTEFEAQHYIVSIGLGILGGVWGGLFCKLNFMWSKWFRSFKIVKKNPVLEVLLIVIITVVLQYPNPLTQRSGEDVIKGALVDCRLEAASSSWICQNEARQDSKLDYLLLLMLGCIVKLVLTIITFGAKVPSGIIIPALGAGALCGRLVGQWVANISPGILAMVGASAFLAGVSRMTISLCVIMLELTGEVQFVLPHMIVILIAKWVAESLSREGVYDLAQHVLGHPFLDIESSLEMVQAQDPAHLVGRLLPPAETMEQIIVQVDHNNCVQRVTLERKLQQLRERGLMDGGLVLVQNDITRGYLAQRELGSGLHRLGSLFTNNCRVRLLSRVTNETAHRARMNHEDIEEQSPQGDGSMAALKSEELDLTGLVDETLITVSEAAPMEYAVECFGRLGLPYLLVTGEGTGRVVGVCLKKRMLSYIESLQR